MGACRARWAGLALCWPRRPAAFALLLGGCALAVFLVELVADPRLPLRRDPAMYDQAARSLLRGHGYVLRFANGTSRYAFWPPGYSFFLAGLYAVVGARQAAALAANAVLVSGAIAFTYLLGRRIAREGIARLGAILFAVLAFSTKMSRDAYSEPLFTVLQLAVVWLSCVGGGLGFAALAGVVLGLAHLVRPVAALLPVALFVCQLLLGHKWRGAAARTLLMLATSCLVVAPWTVRNWRRFHRFVPVSTSGGINLWLGNHPGADGGLPIGKLPAEVRAARDEAEADAIAGRLAVRFILSHPGALPRLLLGKLNYAFGFGDAVRHYAKGATLYRVVLCLVLSTGVAVLVAIALIQGIWTCGRMVTARSRACGWAAVSPLFVAYHLCVPLVFFGLRRFLYPAYPFLGLSVATFCAWLWGIWAHRRTALT